MEKVGLYEAKTKLSALVAQIEATGEKVLLTRHGKIVAELCLPSEVKAPQRGALKSADFMIAEDFDEAEVGFEDFFNSESQIAADSLAVAEKGKSYGS